MMQPGLVTALLWLLYGGTHVVLTMRGVRGRLVKLLGERGFIVVYSLIAIITFAALVHYVALHRLGEPEGSLVATIPPVYSGLLILSGFGFSIFVAGVLVYPRLPMATFRHRVVQARGIQQITRHPFFSGVALFAAAHAFLATHAVTFVFFLGFVILAFVGGVHQDRRMIAELGEPYREYVRSTSWWPFVAVLTGRQRIRWREQPWVAYGIGVGVSLVLREVHDRIFDYGGAWVIGTVTLGSVIAIVNSWSRTHP